MEVINQTYKNVSNEVLTFTAGGQDFIFGPGQELALPKTDYVNDLLLGGLIVVVTTKSTK